MGKKKSKKIDSPEKILAREKRYAKSIKQGRIVKLILAVVGLFFCLFVYRGIQKIESSDLHQLYPIFIGILLGLIFESRRIGVKWKIIFLISIAALLVSALILFGGKQSPIPNGMILWLVIFAVCFGLFILIGYRKSLIPKWTEGHTYIQSLCVIYWVYDYGFTKVYNPLVLILVVLGFSISLFSIFQAFSKIELSRNIMYILCSWSSVVMMLFAIDNISHSLGTDISSSRIPDDIPVLLINYFFLGTCFIYISENLYTVGVALFAPSLIDGGKQKLSHPARVKQMFLDRFSKGQLPFTSALLILFVAVIICSTNSYFHLFNRGTVIWLLFILTPILFSYGQRLNAYKESRV